MITAEDVRKALGGMGLDFGEPKPDPVTERLREQFETAKAAGLHAYGVRLDGVGKFAGGTCTAYVYARTPEEARAKVASEHLPTEERITEVFVQTLKWDARPCGQCPCVLCSDS